MYPLLLKAPIKHYIWGGNRLKNEFLLEDADDCSAEAWMLAARAHDTCTVLNGSEAGCPLTEVLTRWGATALGSRAAAFPYFPLLIKLIDARDRLSVQVHPDDTYALQHENSFGKTEMWYVVDCEPNATLICGFTHDITREEFRTRIEENTLDEVMKSVPVHKGDVFFIPSGTLHAIGAGILIAEIQQNSDLTYRVSDYGRHGADGKPRELHIEKAVAITETAPARVPFGACGEPVAIAGGTVQLLAACEYFTVKRIDLVDSVPIGIRDSFTSVVCLDGNATLTTDSGEPIALKKGSSVFIPAGMSATVSGIATLLCSHI